MRDTPTSTKGRSFIISKKISDSFSGRYVQLLFCKAMRGSVVHNEYFFSTIFHDDAASKVDLYRAI